MGGGGGANRLRWGHDLRHNETNTDSYSTSSSFAFASSFTTLLHFTSAQHDFHICTQENFLILLISLLLCCYVTLNWASSINYRRTFFSASVFTCIKSRTEHGTLLHHRNFIDFTAINVHNPRFAYPTCGQAN